MSLVSSPQRQMLHVLSAVQGFTKRGDNPEILRDGTLAQAVTDRWISRKNEAEMRATVRCETGPWQGKQELLTENALEGDVRGRRASKHVRGKGGGYRHEQRR